MKLFINLTVSWTELSGGRSCRGGSGHTSTLEVTVHFSMISSMCLTIITCVQLSTSLVPTTRMQQWSEGGVVVGVTWSSLALGLQSPEMSVLLLARFFISLAKWRTWRSSLKFMLLNFNFVLFEFNLDSFFLIRHSLGCYFLAYILCLFGFTNKNTCVLTYLLVHYQ